MTETIESAESRTLTIDGKEYRLDDLSEESRRQVVNLRFADQEIRRLRGQLALAETARKSYAAALKAELDAAGAGAA